MNKYILDKTKKNKCTLPNMSETIDVYQIQALRDIPEHGVKKGDFGGFIEHEGNLSQEGAAWIGEESFVVGDSLVAGNAFATGKTYVFNGSRLLDNAYAKTCNVDGSLLAGSSQAKYSLLTNVCFYKSVNSNKSEVRNMTAVHTMFSNANVYSKTGSMFLWADEKGASNLFKDSLFEYIGTAQADVKYSLRVMNCQLSEVKSLMLSSPLLLKNLKSTSAIKICTRKERTKGFTNQLVGKSETKPLVLADGLNLTLRNSVVHVDGEVGHTWKFQDSRIDTFGELKSRKGSKVTFKNVTMSDVSSVEIVSPGIKKLENTVLEDDNQFFV